MSVVLLGSAKGSPGVTTLTMLLARSWPRGAGAPVVVEADPAGGDLAGRLGLPGHPDLTNLAADARHDPLGVGVEPYLQQLPAADGTGDGLAVLGGVGSAVQGRALDPLWPTIAASISRLNRPALVDLGRVAPDDAHLASLAERADLLLLVLRPEVAGVARAVDLSAMLADRRRDLALVLVGEDPYDAHEVAGTTGIPVLGAVPDDPQVARALLAGHGWGPGTRRFRRKVGQLSQAVASILASSKDRCQPAGSEASDPDPAPDELASQEPRGLPASEEGLGLRPAGRSLGPAAARRSGGVRNAQVLGEEIPQPPTDIRRGANRSSSGLRGADMGARR